MHQRSLIIFTFLTLLTLYCSETKRINLIKQTPSLSKLPFQTRSLKATSTGVINLNWPLYAIDVDFTDMSDDFRPHPEGQTNGLMGLALYTNESYFGGDCSSYLKYNCNRSNCFPNPDSRRNIVFPYMAIEGYVTHTELYVDYSFFSSNYMDVTYSQTCNLSYYDPNLNNIYGVIGMGLDGSGVYNFLDEEPKFSVTLDENGLTGQLVFDCDFNKVDEAGYKKTFKASKNWEVKTGVITIQHFSVNFDGKVIFDLNTAEIGLPERIYLNVLTYLNKTYNVTCYDPALSLLGCVYDGDYLKLPPININNEILIPPEVYLHPQQGNLYNLMIVLLTTSNSSEMPSIQVTEEYKNYIILGTPYLQHFYVCFTSGAEQTEISVYEKSKAVNNNEGILQKIYLGIAIGVPVSIFLYFCCISVIKKGKPEKNVSYKESVLNSDSRVIHSNEGVVYMKNSMEGMRKSHKIYKSKTLNLDQIASPKREVLTEDEDDLLNFSFALSEPRA